MTQDEKYTEEFQKVLNDYIKLGFNQDECNGFIHGFHKGAEAQQLILSGFSKSLPTKDAEFIYSLLPDWVKNKAPEGLDPTMYGTLSKEVDNEIQERVKQILGNVC